MIKGLLRAKQNFFNRIKMEWIVGYWYYYGSGTCNCSEWTKLVIVGLVWCYI